jgi:hypothetical protein
MSPQFKERSNIANYPTRLCIEDYRTWYIKEMHLQPIRREGYYLKEISQPKSRVTTLPINKRNEITNTGENPRTPTYCEAPDVLFDVLGEGDPEDAAAVPVAAWTFPLVVPAFVVAVAPLPAPVPPPQPDKRAE